MEELRRNEPSKLVFGLDIGTRSIVGTVGYKSGGQFHVVAQRIREHETRAMLDGQIHDIGRVGETIAQVKAELESVIGEKLSDVCIAAAGRVLKTVTIHAEQSFEEEKEITQEDIYALESKGIEAAYEKFGEENDSEVTFYCVGYSVMRYYMNHYIIGNLESHKAKEIGVDLIATFLPEDVVDGLYKAVEQAGLSVVSLTLEPIAAISVAIPEMYRMLNIALVDVGAGTSDISITQGGSIIAYGMIPIAGDALTEIIAQYCLVDFATAEQIKRDCCEKETIEYHDIMLLPQTIERAELMEELRPVMESMTKQVADRIREMNGDKPVSAVFVVGGGGKIPGYTKMLAEELGIAPERVALRGEEVMQKIQFLEKETKKDSLLVTPIGICLSFYEQSNSFVFVTFNNRRIKLYDNARLAVVDAAMQAEFPNESLFPRRGKALTFTVDGKSRMIRGELGEAAVITVNGSPADIHTPIHANDVIVVKESTAGGAASMEINRLPEYSSVISVEVNEKKITLPKFASVNGTLQSGYYEIQEGDRIEMQSFYTVRQIAEFMDVIVDEKMHLLVNNRTADMESRVYENFSVVWTMEEPKLSDDQLTEEEGFVEEMEMDAEPEMAEANTEGDEPEESREDMPEEPKLPVQICVTVNGRAVFLKGKPAYVFVDVFDYIEFDLSTPKGKGIVTRRNGRDAQYMEQLANGDVIEIYWKE